jgi:hypothetical protein
MKNPIHPPILSGCVAAMLALAGQTSHAAVVNVDFGLHGDHPGGVVSAVYSGTAAAPDSGTIWNEVQVLDNNAFDGPPGEFGYWTSNVTVSNLSNSQGVATGLSVTAIADSNNGTGAFGVLQGSTNLGAVATNAVDLMRDYLIGYNAPRTVELSGFTAGTLVDLYLYGAGDTDNRDTAFSVLDVNGTHTATTTGTITQDGNNPVSHTLTLGGDYVILNGLVADANGKITISYVNGGGSGEAPFDGFQAVYSVPEPAAGIALLLGAIPFARRRRRSK